MKVIKVIIYYTAVPISVLKLLWAGSVNPAVDCKQN